VDNSILNITNFDDVIVNDNILSDSNMTINSIKSLKMIKNKINDGIKIEIKNSENANLGFDGQNCKDFEI
jgi:hypothetical protein